MLPETPAILQVRLAVRAWLELHRGDDVVVALSGGADSLALTAAAAAEADRVRALVVDHGLQDGSAAVAQQAADRAVQLGCASAEVLTVQVGTEGGLEAAARRARYDALDTARAGATVLLGHTLDDQAETVLLGLARGSGARSIWGMRDYDPPWGRPLLGTHAATTRAACVELGIEPHEDPHNDSPDFTRVRLRREVLPLLEDVLGGGVAAALARTADQLREDGAVLDAIAADLFDRIGHGSDLDIDAIIAEPAAVRRRVVRLWLLKGGAKALTDKHLRAVDDLMVRWRGQGGVAVGGGMPGSRLVTSRRHGKLTLTLEKGRAAN
ncbi:tRNA lysidine(34) synthetase TilS [Antrihabitans stalactiti]|uniref:tRNA(Ile)-lysidine synthase n=1 Tax=Antrihabitans stalactiti TaxID=2584121 RepID=A0A848KGR1_9NOCA|nr:tRNA lysidine(34) synthetase TilS [Antrihabitans stalactiti]NMN96898.1 tRNA lysidine(34) synthetase TilS [Antrihabitans stalactiti]